MPLRGRVTGQQGGDKDSLRQSYTYENYSQKSNTNTWKQELDAEYAYRRALEKKFNTTNLEDNKKALEQLDKFQRALQRKATEQANKEAKKALQTALRIRKDTGDKLDRSERKELRQLEKEEWKSTQPTKGQKWADSIRDSIKQAGAAIGKAISNLTNKVDNYIGVYNNYVAGINTRLQGSDKTFSTITDIMTGKLAGSPYVKQTEVIEKLNELVSAGINYNVEQRAFLAAMTDKMVTTFNAANSTLLRIIRLQQADSTIARMGMESALNKFLNATYEDTSYLTDVYDSVESSLVDAISQLSVSQGAEFEYIVQKWLGSLYSVGMDQGTLTSIAEGINYLASGNVTALSSNPTLQNLLVMGANQARLNYAQMLSDNVSISDLNKLLAGVVSYAQGLANTDNLVVKNQYAQLFGLTMSDMTALQQMGDDLSYIIEQELSYSQAITETQNQLKSVGSRTPISEQISNVFDNIMFTAAADIASSTGKYVTWLVTNVVEQATGGIDIPSIGAFVMGTGMYVDLNTSVTQLLKTGLIGFSLLSQIGNIIGSMNAETGLSLEGWGASEYTARGTGFTGITAGSQTTTSQSLTVGNSGGEDIAGGSVTQAQNEATASVGGKEEEEGDPAEEIRQNVATITQILQTVFDDNNSIRVRVMDYGLANSNPNASGL